MRHHPQINLRRVETPALRELGNLLHVRDDVICHRPIITAGIFAVAEAVHPQSDLGTRLHALIPDRRPSPSITAQHAPRFHLRPSMMLQEFVRLKELHMPKPLTQLAQKAIARIHVIIRIRQARTEHQCPAVDRRRDEHFARRENTFRPRTRTGIVESQRRLHCQHVATADREPTRRTTRVQWIVRCDAEPGKFLRQLRLLLRSQQLSPRPQMPTHENNHQDATAQHEAEQCQQCDREDVLRIHGDNLQSGRRNATLVRVSIAQSCFRRGAIP